MSKKRAPKTAAQLSDTPALATEDAAVSPPSHGTNTVQSEASLDAKGKKGKRNKKDEAAKAVKATEGDKKEKREKKDKRGKKNKKAKGKRSESAAAPELRPLRKVNVLLIDPNGQPHAHFDGELGVLDLMLPKKAEGADSGA